MLTIKHKLELTEDNFSRLLPVYLQRASKMYFTPLQIAELATKWLTEDGRRCILDIGAGVGKFCIAGARNSDSLFCGIEYRPSLARLANSLIHQFEIENANVQYGDVKEVDFTNYDAFYMYNPFYENLFSLNSLNDEVELDGSFFQYYRSYTAKQLEKTVTGTRIVTYHSEMSDLPCSFKKIKEAENGTLRLWIKR